MPQRPARSRRRRAIGAVIVTMFAWLAVSACTGPESSPGPATSPAPVYSSGVRLSTLERHDVGDRLTVTAAVATVLGSQAFVIGDVDLPDRGLLVLTSSSQKVQLKSLVTVSGTVSQFDFGTFAEDYRLDPPERYRRFDGHKMVLAESVHSWA